MNYTNNISIFETFARSYEVFIAFSILLAVTITLALLVNGMILYVMIKGTKINSATHFLIVYLASLDLLANSSMGSLKFIGIFKNRSYYMSQPSFCEFISFWSWYMGLIYVFTIGLIGLNKYINICRVQYYQKMFTFKKTIIYAVSLWFIVILPLIPSIVARVIDFNDKLRVCQYDVNSITTTFKILILVFISIPFLAASVSYFEIFRFVYFFKKKTAKSVSNTDVKMNKISKMGIGFAITTTIFFLTCMPYLASLSLFKEASDLVSCLVSLTAHTNSIFNYFIYMRFNSLFKDAHKKVFLSKKKISRAKNAKTVHVNI